MTKPSQKVLARDGGEDRPKKQPMKRRFVEEDEDEGEDAIQMIRNMFKYYPKQYAGLDDDDDSNMEASFQQILKEERISSKEGKREDDIELLKIEEEDRKERMRKKQKLRQRERNL